MCRMVSFQIPTFLGNLMLRHRMKALRNFNALHLQIPTRQKQHTNNSTWCASLKYCGVWTTRRGIWQCCIVIWLLRKRLHVIGLMLFYLSTSVLPGWLQNQTADHCQTNIWAASSARGKEINNWIYESETIIVVIIHGNSVISCQYINFFHNATIHRLDILH